MADNRGGLQTTPPGTPDPRGVMNVPPNNLPYGQRAAMERGLAQVPQSSPSGPTGTPGAPTPALQPPTPNDTPNLSDPTAYPHEPLTTGLSSGPGPGPEVLHSFNHGSEELSILRGIYRNTGADDLRKLIEWVEVNS